MRDSNGREDVPTTSTTEYGRHQKQITWTDPETKEEQNGSPQSGQSIEI